MNHELAKSEAQIEHLFELVRKLPDEAELQSHWAKYICVRVSGHIETSIQAILSSRASDAAAPFVSKFVGRQLRRMRNLKCAAILDVLAMFDDEWKKRAETMLNDRLRDAINSVVAERNNIAHGRTSGITMTRIRNYYNDVKKALDIICKACS